MIVDLTISLTHSISLFFKAASLDAFKTIYCVCVCVCVRARARTHARVFFKLNVRVSLLTFFCLILILLHHF